MRYKMLSLALAFVLCVSPPLRAEPQDRLADDLVNTLLDFCYSSISADDESAACEIFSENAAGIQFQSVDGADTQGDLGLYILCPSETRPFPGNTLPEAEHFFLELSYAVPALWTGLGLEIVEQIPEDSAQDDFGEYAALCSRGAITLRDMVELGIAGVLFLWLTLMPGSLHRFMLTIIIVLIPLLSNVGGYARCFPRLR